jgi:hypothetical protein
MNCQEVQVELSSYLEKSLDSLRMKSIEMHLLSCPLCREEADGVLDCIEQIGQLPVVDPPADFAQRIMAKIREIEVKPPLWQRLFGSLELGMPIPAAAVVVVAVLAVFLYQKESQMNNKAPAELSALSPTPQLPSQEKAVPVGDAAQPNAPTQTIAKKPKHDLKPNATSAPESAVEVHRKIVAESRLSKEQPTPAPQPSAKTENNPVELKDVPRRPPIQAQEVATGRENFRTGGDTFDIGATLGGSLRSGIFAPDPLLSPITEPNADIEFIVRRRAGERNDQADKVSDDRRASDHAQRQRAEAETVTSAATAKRADSVAVAPGISSISEIRWFTVPTERYDQFRKELAAEAAIESEKKTGGMASELATQSNHELLIKVIILTPTER